MLTQKRDNRNKIYESLDCSTKELLDKVVRDGSLAFSDPFDIKRIVRDFISCGEETELLELQRNLRKYVQAIGDEMIDMLMHSFDGTDFSKIIL